MSIRKSGKQARKNGVKVNGVSRRELLKGTGFAAATAALAAGTGAGLGLFGGQAPAYAQQRKVHVVAWSHFIPDADKMMQTFADEFQKAHSGVTVQLEFINANDLPARATAAVESKTGPDIFQFQWNQPWVYANGMIDHGKICAKLGIDKYYPFLKEGAYVNKVWRGVPYYAIGNAYVYRKDWFEAAGCHNPTQMDLNYTYDDFLQDGSKLKPKNQPVGWTMGHTFGDAPANCYPLLWAYGGSEVDHKGKVAINSKETRTALKWFQEMWNAACDPGGLSWDDTSNNRAFYAETISCTQNGASIYVQSKKGQNRPDLKDKMAHFLNPKGPHGRYHIILGFTHSIAAYSPNKEAATEWIEYIQAPAQYERYIHIQGGYGLGGTPSWENDPMWKADPVLAPFRLNAKFGRNFGWPGPYNRQASEVQAKYIIIDLFANVIQGTSIEDSVKRAEKELKLVYEARA
ncbi:MAG TPA: extracellular solute-binding protein [bacterium]|nr:extracellular solute-binding protein [bacterium]